MDWWMMMQPSWQKDNTCSIVMLVLFRNMPQSKTWQGLRKGGTAGIYVVVMGLSWWIKVQCTECDVDTWSAIDDLLWVLQQMNQTWLLMFQPPRNELMMKMEKIRLKVSRERGMFCTRLSVAHC
jgi:hypothetical protein